MLSQATLTVANARARALDTVREDDRDLDPAMADIIDVILDDVDTIDAAFKTAEQRRPASREAPVGAR